VIATKLTKDNVFELADRSRGGRPLVMPNLLGSGFIRNQLGKSSATIPDELEFAERYGYAPYVLVFYSPMVDLISRWADQLCWDEDVVEDEQVVKKTRTLQTPYGELTDRTRYHKETQLTHHVEEMVKDEKDVEAVGWIIDESVSVLRERHSEIKQALLEQIAPRVEEIGDRGLSVFHLWMPNEEVLYPHFTQVSMHYFLHDYPELAYRLIEKAMAYTQFQIEVGIEANVDAMQTAVWGYEQFSPRLYEEHITPYLQASSKQAQAGGVLFWIHTCGHMKGLLENKTYHEFEVDILECLNYPPAGDVDDWPRLRRFVPEGTITKGNLEDSLLWQGPIEKIKSKTWQILEESEGFKHILATSNNIFNDTPLEHFEAMLEAVDEYCAANGLG